MGHLKNQLKESRRKKTSHKKYFIGRNIIQITQAVRDASIIFLQVSVVDLIKRSPLQLDILFNFHYSN